MTRREPCMLLGGAPETAKDLQAAQQLKQRFGCGPRSYWSQALLFDAPCAASRFFRVPSPQRRGTAPALLSAQTGRRLWRGARTSTPLAEPPDPQRRAVLARSGVRGTFSQSGPSHPTVGVRLARTLGVSNAIYTPSRIARPRVTDRRVLVSFSR